MLTLIVILTALGGATLFVQLIVPATQSGRRRSVRSTLAGWIARGPEQYGLNRAGAKDAAHRGRSRSSAPRRPPGTGW